MKKQHKKMMNAALVATLAASTVVAVAPNTTEATVKFKDVSEKNSHAPNILELANREIIKGYSDGTFRPNQPVKRAQAAKIIARVLELDTENVENPGFKDVSKTSEFYGPIAALANAGVINGYQSDKTFRPNGTLTRGQMAKIIAKAFELKAETTDHPFTDIEKSSYKNDIIALYVNAVTTGKTANKYDVASPVTRGQLATFVIRAEAAKEAQSTKPDPIETTPDVVTIDENVTISSVNAGKVIIDGVEVEVAPELLQVFNEENAAALEDAEVTLVVEYVQETVASLSHTRGKAKVVGFKRVKFVKPNTSFNSGKYKIPQVVADAPGLTLTVIAEKFEISGDHAVTLKNSTVTNLEVAGKAEIAIEGTQLEALTVTGDAKVTVKDSTVPVITITGDVKLIVEEGAILEKVVLPEGKKLEDVVENFEAVKDQLKDVVTENVKPKPEEGNTGSGNGPDTETVTDTRKAINEDKLENILKTVIGEANKDTNQKYAKLAFDPSNTKGYNGTLTVTVTENVALTDIRGALKKEQTDNKHSLTGLIMKLGQDGLLDASYATYGAMTSIVVSATENDKTPVTEGPTSKKELKLYVDEKLDVKRDYVVPKIDAFVDKAAALVSATKLNDLAKLDEMTLQVTDEKGTKFTYIVNVIAK